MNGTPAEYDYLLLCDGSSIDKNNYPDLCDKLGGNVLPNLVGKFDQMMNPSSGSINVDIGPSLGFKKGEISSLMFMLNTEENGPWDRANYISKTIVDKYQNNITGRMYICDTFSTNVSSTTSRMNNLFLYRSIGTYNFAENRHNSYFDYSNFAGENYQHRIYVDTNGNVIKTVDIYKDNFDPFSPTPTFPSDSENAETQSLDQSDSESEIKQSSSNSTTSSSINYYICYA